MRAVRPRPARRASPVEASSARAPPRLAGTRPPGSHPRPAGARPPPQRPTREADREAAEAQARRHEPARRPDGETARRPGRPHREMRKYRVVRECPRFGFVSDRTRPPASAEVAAVGGIPRPERFDGGARGVETIGPRGSVDAVRPGGAGCARHRVRHGAPRPPTTAGQGQVAPHRTERAPRAGGLDPARGRPVAPSACARSPTLQTKGGTARRSPGGRGLEHAGCPPGRQRRPGTDTKGFR